VNLHSRDGKNRESDFSSLGPEINDADFLEIRVEVLAAEGLVIGMGKVGIPVCLFPECDDETMGESAVELLRAGVTSPFEAGHEWELGCQLPERLFNASQGLLMSVPAELEKDNMTVGFVFDAHRYLLVDGPA
jgi:hypothetical protein